MDELHQLRQASILPSGVGGKMIDVGAHYGSSLQPFIDVGWMVWAFEPDPENRDILLSKFGSHPRLSVDSRVVTDCDGETRTLLQSSESTGVSGLIPFLESHRARTCVQSITLKTFAREAGIERIDLLKIDVEGYELPVLRGADLTHLSPRVIMCEFEDIKAAQLGYNTGDLADHLRKNGYPFLLVSEWHPIVRYGVQHRWRRAFFWGEETIDPNAWGNLLAFQSERDAAKMFSTLHACLSSRAESGLLKSRLQKVLKCLGIRCGH